MSQWGEARRFIGDNDLWIEVMPNVDTGSVFGKINLHSTIDDVFLMSHSGDPVSAGVLLERTRQMYVGKPYSDWQPDKDLFNVSDLAATPTEIIHTKIKDGVRVHDAGYVEEGVTHMTRRQAFLLSQGLPLYCDADQFSDMVACACGIRFDINDPHPPKCRMIGMPDDYRESIHAAKRAGVTATPLSPRQVVQAQRRLSRLYSTPARDFSDFLERWGGWVAGLAMIAASAALGWGAQPYIVAWFQ